MKLGRLGTIVLAGLLGSVSALAGLPGVQNQTANDRKTVKADQANDTADGKQVKLLSEQFTQAAGRTRLAHETYMQKASAYANDAKSYGGKDPRTVQAAKEEAAAKQEWLAREKEQKDIAAQRNAAIAKLHSADTKHANDVHKLESDEGHPKH